MSEITHNVSLVGEAEKLARGQDMEHQQSGRKKKGLIYVHDMEQFPVHPVRHVFRNLDKSERRRYRVERLKAYGKGLGKGALTGALFGAGGGASMYALKGLDVGEGAAVGAAGGAGISGLLGGLKGSAEAHYKFLARKGIYPTVHGWAMTPEAYKKYRAEVSGRR